MISKVSTKDMSREAWLEKRRLSIGGSDAGTLLGLNPYSSPYALWAEKTGKVIPEDISDKEAVRVGNDLEQYVAERFMEKTGKKVRKANCFIYNSEYPWAHANIDRDVIGEKAGLECKTTSSWEILQQCKEGKYPDTWYAQVTHYMMVTGAERWYLGVLVLGKGFYEFTIERNEDEIRALAAAEEAFWTRVKSNTPPALDGTEATQTALKTVLGDSRAGQGTDLAGVGNHVTMYCALKERIKEMEAELNEHQAIIMQYMGSAEKGSYGNTTVSFKTQQRKTFDRKSFEAANGPIADIFFNTSTSRPFKVTTKKGA